MRAVRRDSLGNLPLHRSSVGWERPAPPGKRTTSAVAGTSSGLTTSELRALADGSLPAESAVVVGPPSPPGSVTGARSADDDELDDDRLDSTTPTTPTSRPTTIAAIHFPGRCGLLAGFASPGVIVAGGATT